MKKLRHCHPMYIIFTENIILTYIITGYTLLLLLSATPGSARSPKKEPFVINGMVGSALPYLYTQVVHNLFYDHYTSHPVLADPDTQLRTVGAKFYYSHALADGH